MNKIFAVAGVVIKELYRRKDFYVLFILTALITGLMACMNFLHDDGAVRALKEICLLLIWISALVMAITTTARQIPFERENRTIFPLLAKPITRWQVVVGKFIGCWLACGIALIVFYVFFALVSASREHTLPLTQYLQAVWLHWQMLGIVVALTLLGSILFTSPAENVTITLIASAGILFIARYLHEVASRMKEPSATILSAAYFAIPHLEFYDTQNLIIHDWPPIEWSYIGGATAYALAYSAFFLLAACLAFRRKALN
jgi:ABC-type transport system involved in multi-copper enzyme maturation permease subunit